MKEKPADALSAALSDSDLNALGQSFPEAADQLERRGRWKAQADAAVADDFERGRWWLEVHMNLGGREHRIHFVDEPEHLLSGDMLSIEGIALEGEAVAESAQVTPGGVGAQAISCSMTGPQNIVVLMARFQSQSEPYSAAVMRNVIFGDDGGISTNGYWQDASYGSVSASGGVFGWYVLDDSLNTCASNYQPIRDAILAQAQADVNFNQYTRIFYIVPNFGCGWAGLGSLGCFSNAVPSNLSYAFMLSNYFSNRTQGVHLSAHEGGHNLTLGHASHRRHGTEPLGLIGSAGTHTEYADPFSTLGTWNIGHYAAPHKAHLTWMNANGRFQTVTGDGAFTLKPYAQSTTGLQALRVQRGTGNDAWIWVEYRQPVGSYDGTLNSAGFAGALIHYEDSSTERYTSARPHSYLIDFTPGTSTLNDARLAGGTTWVDPYSNLTLTIGATAPTGLPITVTYGSNPASPCDANGDGSVNAVDVQLCVNQSLGVAVCVNDINQDGVCNVIDVQRVSNAALGGACVSL